MQEKKKGFTLIELLAVIVILAVVALIATPIVLNLINVARQGAFKRSAEGVLKSAKLYYSSSLLQVNGPEDIIFTCYNNECKSNIPDENGNPIQLNISGNIGDGYVRIYSDGDVEMLITDESYYAAKTKVGDITIDKGNGSNVDLTNDTTPPIINSVNTSVTTNSLQIVVSATDNESGIYGYAYSIDNGVTYTDIQRSNVYTYEGLKNDKEYEVKVQVYNGTYGKDTYSDEKGMRQSESKKLSLQTIETPEITVTPEEWSLEKEVTIDYKGAQIKEYSIDNGQTYVEYINPFTITENISITAKASDGQNEVTTSKTISKIDRELPTDMTLSLNSDTTYAKTKSITVTLQDTGGSGLAAGSIKYGWSTSTTTAPSSYTTVNTSATSGTNTTTFTASGSGLSGSYYLWVVPETYKDNAGNSNTTTIKSTGTFNFDNTAPTLTMGTVSATKDTITVPYTASDSHSGINTTTCEYGTSTSYGSNGTESNGNCVMSGLNSDTTYYYRITTIDKAGNSTYETGNKKTMTYNTGEAVTLGGYNWHVIGDTGTNVTLLMDAGQLGSNRNMKHCTNDTDSSTDCGVDSTGTYYVYSWDKSLIRTYLNSTFLSELESKISNTIVSTEICADPSRGDGSKPYGGYLMSELDALGKTSSCSSTVSDKVRLISPSEYYNMSPHYTSASSIYPNVENITKISSDSDYASWLYCSSTACGNSSGYWWTMGSYSGLFADYVQDALFVFGSRGYLDRTRGTSYGVRPVITIVK